MNKKTESPEYIGTFGLVKLVQEEKRDERRVGQMDGRLISLKTVLSSKMG